MPIAMVNARAVDGIQAPLVRIETHLANGLPGFQIVGLPEAAVRESRDRVRAAIQTSGFEFPRRRITVNLAPADLPKDGGRFDLGIALGILAASAQVPQSALDPREFLGELGLDGRLRAVGGTLPASLAARDSERQLVLGRDDGPEAALASGADVVIADHLLEVCAALNGKAQLPAAEPPGLQPVSAPDLADVRGQHQARRALEIAAAGGHHLLMIGPPGSGKSMLASRIPGILPPMTEAEALETAAIHSLRGSDHLHHNWRCRPFRSPHHTASGVALVGGGPNPRPGEISLAHNGVLFLDELTEFDRRVLDVLREPLETGVIHISRAARHAQYPARFQLVAAMNPCPQGFDCDLAERCQCSPEQRARHRRRLSAPLIDRIDLAVEVPRLPTTALQPVPGEDEASASVAERVRAAHERQRRRQEGRLNSQLSGRELEVHAPLEPGERVLLERAVDKFRLSARAYHRILRVARSIADLADSETIRADHLAEALGFRALDRWRID
ncbi:YifB family Mg chelatase-like AAA ATPase [Thioalkalivibrio paradoxus]|uniref:Fis family transcriptional regulator n=1 Tax=Thioalkalivibrio paradoxus ARh 1 TaxID=713585 RepID=W0DMG0_9GAMM|nr:YifB family Mg chelatase-like AAA ATPase [Thioalkalivibrio paradoxus]AHE99641.1 Fis family transcriptional regulator [Thioalkalivibrio paradoxus ARh 1]